MPQGQASVDVDASSVFRLPVEEHRDALSGARMVLYRMLQSRGWPAVATALAVRYASSTDSRAGPRIFRRWSALTGRSIALRKSFLKRRMKGYNDSRCA